MGWILGSGTTCGSLPYHKGLSPDPPVFLSSQKSTFLNFNSILSRGPDWKQAFGFICNILVKTRHLFNLIGELKKLFSGID
jgi:hypothetical protein